jgi:3,4-dihydroxy 2-butanone 4-phosphate synthase/GTP cyclohydrolase II
MGIEDAIARVRAYAESKGWRKSRLAKEAGLKDTTLRHFDRPTWNPTADTLRRLEAVIPAEFVPQDRAT